MNWNKFVAAAAGAALLCSMSLPAVAAEEGAVEPVSAVYAVGPRKATVESVEKLDVTDQQGQRYRLTVETDPELWGSDRYILNADGQTAIVDNQSGQAVGWDSIEQGTEVYAFTNQATALSLPPQTYAQVLLVNVGDSSPAFLHTIEHVSRTEKGVALGCDYNSIIVSLNTDTPVSTPYMRKVAGLDDFRIGWRMLAWYDIVMTSYPAQTTALRAVLLPPAQGQEKLTIQVNGTAIEETGMIKNGVPMLPVRTVAELAGCTVTWEGETQSVVLTNDKRTMSIKLGEDSYLSAAAPESGVIDMTAPISLGEPPFTDEQGRTWAPAELFSISMGYEVVFSGGEISIISLAD